MTSKTTHTDSPATTVQAPDFSPRLYALGLLVSIVVLGGFWMMSRFIAVDYARDLSNWQDKLNLIAENRSTEVNQWISARYAGLRTLAGNQSLQLYLTELQSPSLQKDKKAAAPSAAEPAPKSYLRNLLIFTAERTGFAPHNDSASIPANVIAPGKSGLALVGSGGDIVVSTPMPDSTRDIILAHAKEALAGKEDFIDLQKDKDGTLYIGFSEPVFAIQGDRSAESQMGRIVGITEVGDNLFGLLKYPGVTEKSLEMILVRRINDKVDFISPLQDNVSPLEKHVKFDPSKQVESSLAGQEGSFISNQKDYHDHDVMATSRLILGTGWTLIVKIDRADALATGNAHRASMVLMLLLVIAVVVTIILALWWYAHSQRSMLMSSYFRRLAGHAQAQEKLLRLVTDNQPESLYIVDQESVVHFANRQAAGDAHMSEESVAGKTLADVRGAARAGAIAQHCGEALEKNATSYDVQRIESSGPDKIIRSAYVPLDHIPVASLPQPTPGVLIVEQDISEAVHERERRLETHRQLVETLVKLVDKRDPFAANHSQLVATLAHDVAVAMELDVLTVEATRTAASLMNIGKIVVPPELLTKTSSLNDGEKRIIRESLHAAADLLSGISFDGPVAESLRQWQEKWDGTGPLGIKGEAILLPARIIAVCNAFVGMISPRSWRTAIAGDAAGKFLLDQSDTFFDRRVVVSLLSYVESQHGKAWIRSVAESQKVA